MSPREKLIDKFKYLMGSDFNKCLNSDLPDDIQKLKLKCYVYSIYQFIEINNNFTCKLKLKFDSNSISVLNNNTLLNTYTYEDIKNLNTEITLSIALFSDWGYLLKNLEISNVQQLLLPL
jgi:hypothetical protein